VSTGSGPAEVVEHDLVVGGDGAGKTPEFPVFF